MRKPRVAIITAVSSELAAFRELLDLDDYTDPADGSVYMRGTLICKKARENCANTWDVILPMPASAGNVISGITTNRVAHLVQPDLVMFVGCAGGISGKVALFDVVVADRVFYYEPGKADIDFIPRPDLAKPSRKMLERAKAEIHFPRWLDYLHPNLPNETPNTRVEPIAAGELLVKNSRSTHMEHVKLVSPRAVAVEQEGFGVLLAAQEAGIEALVVRGISDLLDDKGSDSTEDLAAFNPKQVRATRHAAAFAFSILANLDISWLPDVDFVGANKITKMIVELEGSLSGVKKVEEGLQAWLRDGSLTGLKCSPGSIKAEFSVEAGHAMLLQTAIDSGLLSEIEGHPIVRANIEETATSQLPIELADVMRQIDLDDSFQQAPVQRLRQYAESAPQYRHFLELLTALIAKSIDGRRAARASAPVTEAAETRGEMAHAERDNSNRSRRAKYVDIDVDADELSIHFKNRNFFISPGIRHCLGLLGWSQKQLLYALEDFDPRRSPEISRSSIVSDAAAGEPMTYNKAFQLVRALESLSEREALNFEPRILVAIFSIRDRYELANLSRSQMEVLAEKSNLPAILFDEVAKGSVVTLNVADAMADALNTMGIADRSSVYIPTDKRRLAVAESMRGLAAANRLRPAARPYIKGREFRRF